MNPALGTPALGTRQGNPEQSATVGLIGRFLRLWFLVRPISMLWCTAPARIVRRHQIEYPPVHQW